MHLEGAAHPLDDDLSMTMTNKIRDVELVWTLGAMLAKSAELANGAGGAGASSGSTLRNVSLLIALAAALWYWCFRPSRKQGLLPTTKVGWP